MTYDSTADTQKHIARVQELISDVCSELTIRAAHHDETKLVEPEKPVFDRVTERLSNEVYGSPEHTAARAELGEALVHHYAHNSHHPEHFPIPQSDEITQLRADIQQLHVENEWRSSAPDYEMRERVIATQQKHLDVLESQINGMSLLDVVEMFCDWKAAGERYKGGNLAASLRVNKKRWHISDQLIAIFENTAKELGW